MDKLEQFSTRIVTSGELAHAFIVDFWWGLVSSTWTWLDEHPNTVRLAITLFILVVSFGCGIVVSLSDKG